MTADKSSKKWLVWSVIILLVVAAAIGVFWYQHHNSQSVSEDSSSTNLVIPSTIVEGLKFPVYQPKETPDGYSVLQQPTLQGNILSFSYDHNGQRLNVSEQPIPPSIRVPTNPEKVSLPIGTGWITNIGGRPTGLIQTDKTLVVINSDSNIPSSVISDFMQSFQAVK